MNNELNIQNSAKSPIVKCKLHQMGMYCVPGRLAFDRNFITFSSSLSFNSIKVLLLEISSVVLGRKKSNHYSLTIETHKKTYRFGHLLGVDLLKAELQRIGIAFKEKQPDHPLTHYNNGTSISHSFSSVDFRTQLAAGSELNGQVMVNGNNTSKLKESRRTMSLDAAPILPEPELLKCTATQTQESLPHQPSHYCAEPADPAADSCPNKCNFMGRKFLLPSKQPSRRLFCFNFSTSRMLDAINQRKWLILCFLIIFILLIGLNDLSARVYILRHRLSLAQSRLNELHKLCKTAETCNNGGSGAMQLDVSAAILNNNNNPEINSDWLETA